MIDCMIFTKDRPCQLDALLRSVKDNFKEIEKITILFKASDPKFLEGYKLLSQWHPQHTWIMEKNLMGDIKSIVSMFQRRFCVLFVDDEVIVRKQEITAPMSLLYQRPELHCLSMRMGSNLSYTYTTNVDSPAPPFTRYTCDESILYGWEWKIQKGNTDWEYPSCINSHMYRTNFLKPVILGMKFKHVNDLEAKLNMRRELFAPRMICFEKPKTVSIANNLTQTGHNRHANREELSIGALNDRFLGGERIAVKKLYEIESNTATFEKDYEFEKWH